MGSSLIRGMSCYIVNYLISLLVRFSWICRILLGIILFPLSMGFGLICRTWAFLTTRNRPLDRGDWAFILGWRQKGLNASMGMPSGLGLHPRLSSKGLNASTGMPLLWGLTSERTSPFFKLYHIYICVCVCVCVKWDSYLFLSFTS